MRRRGFDQFRFDAESEKDSASGLKSAVSARMNNTRDVGLWPSNFRRKLRLAPALFLES